MARYTVSTHEVRVFAAFAARVGVWLSNHEVAEASSVGLRTTRAHTAKLLQAGLLERMEVSPGHLFRLPVDAERRSPELYQQLQSAADALNVPT